ncbi:MAG TPA: four helix bundle protein [Terriglobales bacterium]|nr:four helix bundle protein [Terriglobales bacterium]
MAKSYRDLIAWQKAIQLVTDIYKTTRQFPKEEIYGLTSQIRRAAVSVPSNIAEGQARLSRLEFKNFLSHARSSLVGVETQLLIARNLGYLSEPAANQLLKQTTEVARILNGLLNTVRTTTENRELRTEN